MECFTTHLPIDWHFIMEPHAQGAKYFIQMLWISDWQSGKSINKTSVTCYLVSASERGIHTATISFHFPVNFLYITIHVDFRTGFDWIAINSSASHPLEQVGNGFIFERNLLNMTDSSGARIITHNIGDQINCTLGIISLNKILCQLKGANTNSNWKKWTERKYFAILIGFYNFAKLTIFWKA